MNTFFLKTKKIIAIIIITSIFTPQISLAQGLPVMDAQNTILNYMDTIKEYGLDSVAYMLTDLISAKISNAILNKANGGASGDSSNQSFIENFSDWFANKNDAQIQKFVEDIGASKNPYASQVAMNIITKAQSNTRRTGTIGSSKLDAFNLDSVIGANNVERFSSDASAGGWDGMLALLNPVNSSLGSVLIAQQELDERILQDAETERLRLMSAGTTPQGTCNMDFAKYKKDIQGLKNDRKDIKTSRDGITFVREQLSELEMTDEHVNELLEYNPNLNLNNLEKTTEDYIGITDLVDKNKALGTNMASTSINLAEDFGTCLSEMINNPAAFVTEGITEAVTFGMGKAAEGDELMEMLSTIFTKLINTFVTSGISALKTTFQKNRASIGGPEQLVGANGQSISWTDVPNTIVNLAEEFQPTLEDTEAEVEDIRSFIEQVASSTEQESKDSLTNIITELDQCIPGPDYGYEERFSAYVSKQIKSLERKKNRGKEKKTTPKNNAVDSIEASVETASTYMQLAMASANRNIPAAGAMLANVESITETRQQYQNAKSDLRTKTVILNSLYSIEGELGATMQILNKSLTDLPRNIPFTNSAWAKMTSADQITATNWMKKTALQVKENTYGITSADLPLTTADWNALSVTKKTALVQWSQKLSGTTKPVETPDKNFVLAVIYLLSGIQTGTPDTNIKRDFVITQAWNIWENPEYYMSETASTEWNKSLNTNGICPANNPSCDTQNHTTTSIANTRAEEFMNAKNTLRGKFYALRNDVSMPYTREKAKNNLERIKTIKDVSQKFLYDCEHLKKIVNENRNLKNDSNGHEKLLEILKARSSEFKSTEMRSAFESGLSAGILNSNPIFKADDFRHYGITNCTGSNDTITCWDDADIVPANYELDDNDDNFDNDQIKEFTSYQVQPAKNIWDLIDQGGNAFCGLNKFLGEYAFIRNQDYKIPRKAMPVTCSNDWYQANTKTIRSVIFSTDVKNYTITTAPR